ncbi:hypothetical protein B484DRAFT_463780, partial [Ochromonadaceae sp. CCMP2298]
GGGKSGHLATIRVLLATKSRFSAHPDPNDYLNPSAMDRGTGKAAMTIVKEEKEDQLSDVEMFAGDQFPAPALGSSMSHPFNSGDCSTSRTDKMRARQQAEDDDRAAKLLVALQKRKPCWFLIQPGDPCFQVVKVFVDRDGVKRPYAGEVMAVDLKSNPASLLLQYHVDGDTEEASFRQVQMLQTDAADSGWVATDQSRSKDLPGMLKERLLDLEVAFDK